MKKFKNILPDYPRTQHLPHKANATKDDIIATEADIIFAPDVNLFIEEKIDGSHAAMCLYEGHPVIRNRSHILNKGYLKDTPAKLQFRPAWGWFYENKEKFEKLNELVGFEIGVYGEWMYALHGCFYDKLPDLFIAYDLYDYIAGQFLATNIARELLISVGFVVPPLLHTGKIDNWEQLEVLCNEPSVYSTTDKREGLYFKISNEKHLIGRYKMVREGFVQGCGWDEKVLTKNKILKK